MRKSNKKLWIIGLLAAAALFFGVKKGYITNPFNRG